MMSILGALRVVLGMDAGEFKKGAKESESRLDRLGRKFGITARQAKIAGAAMGAAITGTAVAVGVSVNRALADFDKLTKLSRSIGVPVEEMSKLEHAAELSGASIEELGRAFRNVARNMQGAARAPTDFSRALDSLNVHWRDAEGNFRRADQLLLDVADRFATMEDGAGKTALAMRIFGEEMGPRLVSLLNSGSTGIEGMTAEAERLGIAFDTAAGEAAERFNDQMDRIGKVNAGFTTHLTRKMLPALELLVNKYAEWSLEGEGMAGVAHKIAFVFTSLTDAALRASSQIDTVWLRMKAFAHNTADLVTFAWSSIEERNRIVAAREAKLHGDLAHDLEKMWSDFYDTMSKSSAAALPGSDSGAGGPSPVELKMEGLNEAIRQQNLLMQEGAQIMAALRSPWEEMEVRQDRLNELFRNGAIDASTFGRASEMAAAAMHNAYAGASSKVSGALAKLFAESKGIAIANALINTYEAMTAALKNPPGPPFSYVYAAAAFANGMAQVSAIRSTNKNGGGSGGSVSGGASATPAAAASNPAPQSLFIQGISAGSLFSDTAVRELIGRINDVAGDNVRIVVGA